MTIDPIVTECFSGICFSVNVTLIKPDVLILLIKSSEIRKIGSSTVK